MSTQNQTSTRSGFTLVEMLIVIAIIGVLAGLLFPVIGLARAQARKTQCQNNLRQIGQTLTAYSDSNRQAAFCSGAFDWRRDGAVTETGWVADCVLSNGARPGEMLCPSNPGMLSETYADLIEMPTSDMSNDCVSMSGREPTLDPAGNTVEGPCYEIMVGGIEFGDLRTSIVTSKILNEGFNTNYTASWYLVRGEVELDTSGNLKQKNPACAAGILSRNSTTGPLTLRLADNYKGGVGNIPLMGDGGLILATTKVSIGDIPEGTLLVKGFTNGPARFDTGAVPSFSGPTETSRSYWWKTWAEGTLQSYASFAPLHNNTANILFADGSVVPFKDMNRDDHLNSGFNPNGVYADNVNEMVIENKKRVATTYKLSDSQSVKALN